MYKKKSASSMLNKLINEKKYILIIIFSILIYGYFRRGISYLPVEELDIPSGIGLDIIQKGPNNIDYTIPISFYIYGHEMEISSLVQTGTARSIAETRELRQLLSDKKMILGLERIELMSEEFSRFGIEAFTKIMFKNPNINDTGLVAVCKGKPEDVLSYNIPEYASSADYIEGMLERSTAFNFFSDNYKIIDMFVRIDAEGRNVVLPYIELKNGKIEITGMALFDKYKMIRKIDIDDAKAMNLLRENKVTGMLAIQETPKEYISYYTKTKRKVRCEKKEDKYTFNIDLSLTGEILENNLFPDIRDNEETMKKFENQMSKEVEKMSYDFIEKMQKEYKYDCLELGRFAAAKYGRDTGVDWNEVVSKSDIKVNVEINVVRMGRGDY